MSNYGRTVLKIQCAGLKYSVLSTVLSVLYSLSTVLYLRTVKNRRHCFLLIKHKSILNTIYTT